jgi:hypothetical protein
MVLAATAARSTIDDFFSAARGSFDDLGSARTE